MSIKRSSKSMGTATRKSAASPAVRHVEVMMPRQMSAGEAYVGWLCRNKACARVIAISPQPTAEKPAPAAGDDSTVVIKCPHCADENLYRLSALAEQRYLAPGAT